MAKKNDKKGEAAAMKLEPDEGLQLENLNLAVEREEIFTRMDMLNKECKKFKVMYQKLENKHENLDLELQQERERALQDRTDADKERMTLELEVKKLKEQAVRQQEQTETDRAVERKSYEDQIKILEDQVNTLLQEEA